MAQAQNFDFNLDASGGFASNAPPASTFGAASGQTGLWMNLDVGISGTPQALTDISGNLTSATVQFSTGFNFNFNNANTSGDDERLLDDTQCTGGGTVWTFNGLQAGDYEVFSYAWAPDVPTSYITNVSVVGSPDPAQDVGGQDFLGTYVQGGHYAQHDVVVGSSGQLTISFQITSSFGTINGVQLREGQPGASVGTYCTSGTTTNGCVPIVAGLGTPSASAPYGFTIIAANVEGQKQGIIFYGISGQQAQPWASGSSSYLCVKAPTQRMVTINSGGDSGACNGTLATDWNYFMANNPSALGNPRTVGQAFDAQAWFRDPPATKTTNLSAGVHFTLGP
jgi:hypothetical protein